MALFVISVYSELFFIKTLIVMAIIRVVHLISLLLARILYYYYSHYYHYVFIFMLVDFFAPLFIAGMRFTKTSTEQCLL